MAHEWLRGVSTRTVKFEDRTDVACLHHLTDALASVPPTPPRSVITDALSQTILSKLDMTFVAVGEVFPFIVGDVATNSVAEYLMFRQLVTVSRLWKELASAPSLKLAQAMLDAIDTHRQTVQANTAQSVLPLPGATQMCRLQENLANMHAAATQVVEVQHAATGVIADNALVFAKREWSLVHHDKVRVAAALHHMKMCAEALNVAETVDRDLLSTAIEWSNMLPRAVRDHTDAYRTICEYQAAARKTNMQLPLSVAASEQVNTWGRYGFMG